MSVKVFVYKWLDETPEVVVNIMLKTEIYSPVHLYRWTGVANFCNSTTNGLIFKLER